LTGGSFV